LAEYERAKILERTRRGTVGRIQAGHPWGGRVPLGYRYISEPHGGRFEIEEEEAALVRRIYAMCLGGMSLRAIARQLTAEGLPTPLERRAVDRTWRRFPPGTWQPTTVRDLLTAEAYTGRAAWGKRQNLPHTKRRRRTPESEWVPLAIPPVIDAATFQAAQTALPVWTQFHFSFRGVEAPITSARYGQNASITFSFPSTPGGTIVSRRYCPPSR
jgi:site-specific DNA recombinase